MLLAEEPKFEGEATLKEPLLQKDGKITMTSNNKPTMLAHGFYITEVLGPADEKRIKFRTTPDAFLYMERHFETVTPGSPVALFMVYVRGKPMTRVYESIDRHMDVVSGIVKGWSRYCDAIPDNEVVVELVGY